MAGKVYGLANGVPHDAGKHRSGHNHEHLLVPMSKRHATSPVRARASTHRCRYETWVVGTYKYEYSRPSLLLSLPRSSVAHASFSRRQTSHCRTPPVRLCVLCGPARPSCVQTILRGCERTHTFDLSSPPAGAEPACLRRIASFTFRVGRSGARDDALCMPLSLPPEQRRQPGEIISSAARLGRAAARCARAARWVQVRRGARGEGRTRRRSPPGRRARWR